MEPASSPYPSSKAYPLVLPSAKLVHDCHGQHRKAPSLRRRAKFDPDLDHHVVSAHYGWWQSNTALDKPGFDPFPDKGANYNRLIDDGWTDPVSGSTGLRSFVWKVLPVRQYSGWKAGEATAEQRHRMFLRL